VAVREEAVSKREADLKRQEERLLEREALLEKAVEDAQKQRLAVEKERDELKREADEAAEKAKAQAADLVQLQDEVGRRGDLILNLTRDNDHLKGKLQRGDLPSERAIGERAPRRAASVPPAATAPPAADLNGEAEATGNSSPAGLGGAGQEGPPPASCTTPSAPRAGGDAAPMSGLPRQCSSGWQAARSATLGSRAEGAARRAFSRLEDNDKPSTGLDMLDRMAQPPEASFAMFASPPVRSGTVPARAPSSFTKPFTATSLFGPPRI